MREVDRLAVLARAKRARWGRVQAAAQRAGSECWQAVRVRAVADRHTVNAPQRGPAPGRMELPTDRGKTGGQGRGGLGDAVRM